MQILGVQLDGATVQAIAFVGQVVDGYHAVRVVGNDGLRALVPLLSGDAVLGGANVQKLAVGWTLEVQDIRARRGVVDLTSALQWLLHVMRLDRAFAQLLPAFGLDRNA